MAEIINRSFYDAAEKGRQDRQAYQQNALTQQLGQQRYEQNALAQSQQLDDRQKETAKEFAMQMVNAARYAEQVPPGQTKAFIEQNFPLLKETYGPEWATADDDQVRQQLTGIAAKFGTQAGVGPAGPQDPGPLESFIGPNGQPVLGTRRQALGQRPYDKPPQVVQQFTPVQTETGIGSFNSRTGQVTSTGVKAPVKDPSGKPPTEGDKRARVMYMSMKNAEKQLEGVSGADTADLMDRALGKVGLGVLNSEEYKKYEAAGLRWAANLLYLKSGATATPDEIRSTWRQFFPQPGDGKDVKAQKAEARSQELTAVNDSYSFESGADAPGAAPATAPSAAANVPTATGPNGQKLYLRNGQWVPQ